MPVAVGNATYARPHSFGNMLLKFIGEREKTWQDSEKFRFQPLRESLSAVYLPDAVWEIVPCFFWQRF